MEGTGGREGGRERGEGGIEHGSLPGAVGMATCLTSYVHQSYDTAHCDLLSLGCFAGCFAG